MKRNRKVKVLSSLPYIPITALFKRSYSTNIRKAAANVTRKVYP
jgi:hypothetical protein